MAYDNSSKMIKNGTPINPKINTTKIADANRIIKVFGNEPVDLNSRGLTKYKGVTNNAPYKKFKPFIDLKTDGEKTSVNKKMVEALNNIGMIGLNKNTTLTTTALHGFSFQQQEESRTSTVEAAVKAMEKINTLETNKTGALYVFDLETFGGTTDDNRWSPAGITEFAMQKHNFKTGKRAATNILMTNNETVSELERYLDKYIQLMEKGGIEKVKEHNDIYVFAQRMSLYDPDRGATFEKVNGIWQATNLIPSEKTEAGNVDAIIRSVKNFREMSKDTDTIDPITGLSKDVKALISASGEMTRAVSEDKGIIGGHNILQFDRGILDKDIRKIYNMQLDKFNNPKATEDELKQSMAAIEFIEKSFGGNVGLNFKKGSVLDTFPLAKAATNEGGFASPNLQLGTLAEKFYPNLAASGTAHLGVHDTAMNISMILDATETLGDKKSLMRHLTDDYLSQYNANTPIIEVKPNQVFKITNTPMTTSITGKGYFNFKEYHNTGEIYTSGGYKIANGKIKYNKYSGNVGLEKGGFYTVNETNIINLDKITDKKAKEQLRLLQEAYPEMNTNKLYHVAMTNRTATDLGNSHTVHMFFPTQEEAEAMLSSSGVHVADITKEDKYKTIESGLKHVVSATYDLDTKQFSTETTTDIITDAIARHEKKVINDRTNSTMFTGSKAMKNIKAMLSFDEEARVSGLSKGLDSMLNDNVSLTTILKSNSGTINGTKYFDDKELKNLKKLYINKFGSSGEIDHRRLINTSNAYEAIMNEKQYYKDLITVVQDNFNGKSIPNEEMNEYFLDLNKRIKTKVLKEAGYEDKEVIRMVNNFSNHATREYQDFANKYDFKLGRSFKKIKKSAPKIEDVFSMTDSDDIITYNLNDNFANSKFINKLYKLRVGPEAVNKKHKQEYIDANKREAVHNFFIDLHNNTKLTKQLYQYEDFKKYVNGLYSSYESTGKIGKDFDPNEGLTLMREAIKKAKDEDLMSGVRNVIGDINLNNEELANHLESVTERDMQSVAKTINSVIKYNDKSREDKVKELVNVFGISDFDLERALENASPAEIKSKTLIAKIANEQMYNYIDDQLKTAAYLGNTVYVDKNARRMFLESKNKAGQEITKIPKLTVNEDGIISTVIGGSNIALDLKSVYNEETKTWDISTNLDEAFGKKDYFFNIARTRKSLGEEPDLSMFDQLTGIISKETYENSRITGLKTDLTTANRRIDLSDSTKSIRNVVMPEGRLNNLLDNYEPVDNKMLSKVRSNPRFFNKDGGLTPQGFQALVNDVPGLAKLTLNHESKYYNEVMEILDFANPSNKETQLAKGTFQIGDRVIATLTNTIDNPQRPPMTGAGNIFYLNRDDIAKLKGLNVLPGSIIESNDTLRLIEKETDELSLVSDFRARQLYMSGPNIQARLKSYEDIIMNADIDNVTVKQATEKKKRRVYKKLTDLMTSGTYEQSRIGDTRVFGEILNKPIDVQNLSVNKDVIGAISNNSDAQQLEKLRELFGQIEREEDGKLVYKRNRTGTIVRKGESVAEYLGYGDIKQSFGSKFDMGVLSFSVSSNNQELTDKQISKILNEYSKEFSELDEIEDQDKMLKKLFDILKERNLDATYKIANINRASLLKVQDSGVEKGMTLLPQIGLGKLNEDVAAYFKYLGTGFNEEAIPTNEAIMALHEDIAKREKITVDELIQKTSAKVKTERKDFTGFNNIQDILNLVKDEREAMAVMAFGPNGPFSGFASVANDNIPKHENMGLSISSGLEEAIYKVSKASGKSQKEAAIEIRDAMQNKDDINFIRHTVNGMYDKTKGYNYDINESGMFIIKGGEKENLVVDKEKITNFFEYANDLIVKYNAEATENEKLVHENIWTYTDEGWKKYDKDNPLIGSFEFEKREYNGEERLTVVGAANSSSHAIIKDSETESGVSQEYIEAKKFINRMSIKDPNLLTDKEKQDLKLAREFTSAQKDNVSFVKIDDNTTTLLSSKRFNKAVENELKYLGERSGGQQQLSQLKQVLGDNVSYENGKISFSDDIMNTGYYDGILNEIREYRYYNPVEEAELTDELLKTKEYSHLKDTVKILRDKGVDKVGIESAQNLYNLSKNSVAADFNNSKIFDREKFDNLINKHGFELMDIKDYVPTNGVADTTYIESIRNKNILLDLGENFSESQRYIAIPAGGQQIGSMETLSSAQGKINQLKTQSDVIRSLEIGSIPEGDTNLPNNVIDKLERTTDKMLEIRKDIINEVNKYPEKGGAFSKATVVNMPESANRAKILSVTSTTVTNDILKNAGLESYVVSENSEAFMKKAMITMSDGTDISLLDLEKRGYVPDFERVGIEKFREAGYFDPKEMAKYGFTDPNVEVNKEKMAEYLETYGTANLNIRYPLIKEESIYGTRTYLDRSLDGTNARSVSSASMLKVNGDSDGDSMSTLQVKIRDTSYALYEHQKREAMQELKQEDIELTQNNIKNRVVSKGIITEDTYKKFNQFESGMALESIMVNPKYLEQVQEDMLTDVGNNIKVGKVTESIYQLKNAESETLRNLKVQSRNSALTGKELLANDKQVQEAINTILASNTEVFKDTLDNAKKISDGSLRISEIAGTEKYSILDNAMQGLEALKENGAMDGETFSSMQKAIIERVRNQQLMEEAEAKAGKSVIGSVNKSLAGLRTMAGTVYKNESSQFYNQSIGNILFKAADEIEQQVISSKKMAFELGEMRAQEIGDILKGAVYDRSGGGINEKEKLADWLTTYMPESSTNKIWDSLPTEIKTKHESEHGAIKSFITANKNSGLSEEELTIRAKNKYIADQVINASRQIHNTPELRDTYKIQMNIAYTGSNAANLSTKLEAPDITAKSEVYNITKEITQTEIGTSPKKSISDLFKDQPKENPSDMLDLTDFAENLQNSTNTKNAEEATEKVASELLTQIPKLNVGTIGIAALGVAAGLMVAGYAGGGHQRPTKPQDDSQPVQVQPMLDDGGGDTGMRQQGYVINIKADTDKGARHLKKTLKDVAKASSNNGDVTINMNYKTTSGGGYSNKDIENIINNFI